MSQIQRFLIRSQRVLLPDGERPATIEMVDGKFESIRSYEAYNQDGFEASKKDFGAWVLMPGLVDTHVHLNEPGRTNWEGFQTGTSAAAAGGITTLIDMPLNSSPVTCTVDALKQKQKAANGKLSTDVGFYAGLVPDHLDEIEHLIDAGVRGVKVFLCHSGIDEFPNATYAQLQQVMPVLAKRKIPLLVHAELVHSESVDSEIGDASSEMADPTCYMDYLRSRPRDYEQKAIAMMMALCAETNCHTHIVHLSDADSLPMLQKARENGLPVTVETCPHYLVFAAEEIADRQTQFKCAPPIREAENAEKLWAGLASGLIDMVVSDHSPCLPEMKALETGRFDQAWGGISSLQLGLSVMWTHAKRRGFELTDVVDWMGVNPAKLINHSHGIVAGNAAHLVVFDPDAKWIVDAAKLKHRHPVTPYHGLTLEGQVKQTYVHGHLAQAGIGQLV